MKFFHRTFELNRLNAASSAGAEHAYFMHLIGPTRVGKTALIRHFADGRSDYIYFKVTKKKPRLLLAEFKEILAEHFPSACTINNYNDFFIFLLEEMSKASLFIVLDDFQNFHQIDDSIITSLQQLSCQYTDKAKGKIWCLGPQTSMQKFINDHPNSYFGTKMSGLTLKPFTLKEVAMLLIENSIDPTKYLLQYFTIFGGIPHYYSLLSRHKLFKRNLQEQLIYLFCQPDAILQTEGKDLLIEEVGKNYYLYFSILEVIAKGKVRMVQIAEHAGISVSSISKYLEELADQFQIIERRHPVTSNKDELKSGRYYIKDHFLQFWFRYIYSNQTLVSFGYEQKLLNKIKVDLPNLMEQTFKNLITDILSIKQSTKRKILPFELDKIGAVWNKSESIDIGIVAINEKLNSICFAESRLNGNEFTVEDANKLKQHAVKVKWGNIGRKEYYALFSHEDFNRSKLKQLEKEGINCFDLKSIL